MPSSYFDAFGSLLMTLFFLLTSVGAPKADVACGKWSTGPAWRERSRAMAAGQFRK